MRPWFWYAREVLAIAAVVGFCVAMVQWADRLQPGAFPR